MTPKYFLEKLQQLPHRGFGSENERKAARLIYNEYKKMGFRPKTQKFQVVKNSWFIHSFYFSIFLTSTILLLQDNILLSIILYVMGLSLYFEYLFDISGIVKKIYSSTSQHVYVEVKPRGKIRRNIVVLGHYDTAKRTMAILLMAKIFTKKLDLVNSIDRKLPNFLRSPYLFSNISLIILFLMFFLSSFSTLRFFLACFVIYNFTVPLLFSIHAALSPFVPGAMDNGSGTATVMSLANYFKKYRLKSTRLIFLNNGNEENMPNGAGEFVKRVKLDKKKTYFINLDGVGADKLVAAYGESRLNGRTLFYDQLLYNIVRNTIKQERRFSSVKKYYLPVGSDASGIIKNGHRVMTTLLSLSKNGNGYPKQYHQMTDTIDKINFKTMDLCKDFVIELIKRVDK